ncbi:MAG: sensor histidine kinase [Ktedonobacterales bacterium]
MRDESPLLPQAQFGGNYDWMLEVSAYLAVAGGYLLAILTASNLTLLGFSLLTAGNLAWVYVFRSGPSTERIFSGECSNREIGLWSAALAVLTLLCLQAVRFGMGFDWLLPLATIGVFSVMMKPRVAVGLSLAMWLGMSISLLGLENGWTPDFTQSQLTLSPAVVFTFAFAFVVRQQYIERRRAEALVTQLEEAQQQLRRYAGEVEELTVTRERNSMAREIHDTLGHYLTILAVKLETATKLEERGDQRVHAELLEARRVASECLVEVRRSVAALRPLPLSSTQLKEVLLRLVQEFEASAPETEVTLDVEGSTDTLSAEIRLALYRSAQESLTNIRKHAHASKVLLRMRIEARRAELLIRDNGVGATGLTHEPGFGLTGMHERIALLGGVVTAGPEPERGWRVEVALPVPDLSGQDNLSANFTDKTSAPNALAHHPTSQQIAASGDAPVHTEAR